MTASEGMEMDFDALLAGSRPVFGVNAPDVRRYRDLAIPMRDGVVLAADVYLPAAAPAGGQLPVVMEYIPYRKDQADLAQRPFYLRLPRLGYLFVRVDVRGTGASAGATADEYTHQEQIDGYDAVEWIAAQDWCDGQINMMGISYGGFTALQVAALAPPHLRTIIPVMFTDDRYQDECHYRGGLKRLYYNISYYGGQMIAWNALPPVLDDAGPDLGAVWRTHLEENEPYLLQWYRHQTDGAYWRNGSVGRSPEEIRCPVFMIGGWRDGYVNCNLRLYEKLSVPKKVLVGPWNHAMPDMAVPGPRIDYMKEVGRWLDYWCKDTPNGIMDEAPVWVFMQASEPPDADRVETRGVFRGETDWPVPGRETAAFHLGAGGCLTAAKGGPDPGSDGSDELVYEPTVGVCGGLFSGGLPFGLPCDQRPDEALSLAYTTPPLDADLAIMGRPRVAVHVSTDAPVIGVAVSLNDVAPDGSSHLVTKGMLNITRRNSLEHPEPAVAGEIYPLEIELDATAWVFKPGQRIRLAIANADWPNVWPTPYPAVSRIYFGATRPASLLLPTVPLQGSAAPPDFAPSPALKTPFKQAVTHPQWQVRRDMITGRCTVDIGSHGEWRVSPRTVFKRDSSGSFSVAPDDPAHAAARGRHHSRLVSPNVEIAATADIAIQATPSTFQVMISLTVEVNQAQLFHKSWIETIPRNLL